MQSLSLTSEQSFQKEALHWHWFVKMHGDVPGKPKSLVFKDRNKNKWCPCVNAYEESTVIRIEMMPVFSPALSSTKQSENKIQQLIAFEVSFKTSL